MVSLGIIVSMTVISLLITAWALSWSVRAVGSPRGRFRLGLIVVVLLLILGIAFAVIGAAVTPAAPLPALVTGLALLIVQLGSIFFILRSTFKLNVKRTFAPFGVYVALILAQL